MTWWRGLNPRTQFGIAAAAGVIVFYGLGLVLADYFIAAMQPVASLMASMFGLANSIVTTPDGGWVAHTNLRVISNGAAGMQFANIPIDTTTLHVLLRGAPLFLALMCAPPWNRKLLGQIGIGVAILLLGYVLSIPAVLNGKLAVTVNHVPDPMGFAPPDFLVAAPPYGRFPFFLASFFFYVAMMVWPIVGPVALWLLLKREAITLLLARTPPAPKDAPEAANP